MVPKKEHALADRLREYCKGDLELLELVDVLVLHNRYDLLQLFHDFRELCQTDQEMQKGAGGKDALDRQFLEIHRFFVPIARRHFDERNAEKDAGGFYKRICEKKEKWKSILEDPNWSLSTDLRDRLRRLYNLAVVRPPVRYEALPERLGLAKQQVREVLRLFHDRYLERRRQHGDEGLSRYVRDGRAGSVDAGDNPTFFKAGTAPIIDDGHTRAATSPPECQQSSEPAEQIRQRPPASLEENTETNVQTGREMP
jgi:hypothetical protein